MNKKWAILSFLLLLFVGMVSASDVSTNRLNFYETEQHIVNITNTLGASANSTSTMPSGFVFVSSTSGCTNPSGQTVTCDNISSGADAEFIMNSTGSGTEYTLYVLNTTLNGTALNNVSFINIRDDEIFHSLVEFGRGRGNYFYDSMGTSTSAGTGTGYNYVPNGTAFELNYLHKVYNIKQYFSLATSRATDVEFSCVYPYHTVVRSHLVETISDDESDWTVVYSLPRIDGSWERMGFLGMDFDAGEYDVGENFTINCTGLQYTLADAYGDIVVDEDSFSMQVRSPDPVSVTATSSSSEIGNGTSEVEITYTFTNDEVYPMDSVIIEIDAPEEAQFIGVRGELWGFGEDKYRYELTTMEAGQSETLTLVARFDTSSSADTTLLLSQGINVKFVPTWELNAYNPMTYIQEIAVTDTQTVNYSSASSINSLQDQITRIETNTETINSTINTINTLVAEINSTTHTTSANLLSINTTIMTELANINSSLSTQINNVYNNLTSDISDLSTQVTNFEAVVQALVNCTSTPTAPLCVKMDTLNTSVNNLQSDLTAINTSLSTQINNVNTSIMTELSTQFTNVFNNFTAIDTLIDSVNTTIMTEIGAINTSLDAHLDLIDTAISDIDSTVTNIETNLATLNNSLLSINTSLSNQINTNTSSILTAISSGFSTIDSATDEILLELTYMQGFNEELIFLVTDSVGLATAGQVEFDNGNTEGAIENLKLAEEKLIKASQLMEKQKKSSQNELKIETTSNVFSKMVYIVKGWFL